MRTLGRAAMWIAASFVVLCAVVASYVAFLDWRDGPVSLEKAGTAHLAKETRALIESAFGVTAKEVAAGASIDPLARTDWSLLAVPSPGFSSVSDIEAAILRNPRPSLQISTLWIGDRETRHFLDELTGVGRRAGYAVRIDELPEADRVVDPNRRVTVTMTGSAAHPEAVLRWLLLDRNIEGIQVAVVDDVDGSIMETIAE